MANPLCLQPGEQVLDGEVERAGEGWHGEVVVWVVEVFDFLTGAIDKDGLLARVDEPAHLSAVFQSVKNIFGDFGLTLVWR